MADAKVDDLLWRALEPLLPPRGKRPKGGHPFADNRACLMGVLFVLRTERPWRVRWERKAEHWLAFALLECALCACDGSWGT